MVNSQAPSFVRGNSDPVIGTVCPTFQPYLSANSLPMMQPVRRCAKAS
jgi:hypothetical protein